MDSGRCISFKWEPPLAKFYFYGKFLENVKSHSYLGVEIDIDLDGRITNTSCHHMNVFSFTMHLRVPPSFYFDWES